MKAVLTIGIFLLLISCTLTSNVPANQPDKDQMVVGVSIPDTSFASTMGLYVRQGLTLAEQYVGDSHIKLIYEDDQCNGIEGRNVADKLVNIDDVSYVLGPFCAPAINPTMQFYEENKVLRIITGLGVDAFTTRGRLIITPLGDVEQLMRPLADHAIDQGHLSVGVLYQHNDYGEENVRYFTEQFESQGGRVLVVEKFDVKRLDYREELTKIQSLRPDIIFLVAQGNNFLNAMQQIKELGSDIPVYSIRNTEDTEIIKATGDASNAVIYPSLTDKPISPKEKWFAEQYELQYGAPHEVVSANAFDSYLLLHDAIEICDLDVVCAEQIIKSQGEVNGASGMFRINDEGLGERKVLIKQVQDGEFVVID